MAITISTQEYVNVHGKAPTGRAQWAFHRAASHGEPGRDFFSPDMNYREACAWVRRQIRAEGFQDAQVEVWA